jgi:hypothetical protein
MIPTYQNILAGQSAMNNGIRMKSVQIIDATSNTSGNVKDLIPCQGDLRIAEKIKEISHGTILCHHANLRLQTSTKKFDDVRRSQCTVREKNHVSTEVKQ